MEHSQHTDRAPTHALFFLMRRPAPRSTLFPYTTLFRSLREVPEKGMMRGDVVLVDWPYSDRTGSKLRPAVDQHDIDRKSTRLNSSHTVISYAVFCLKKKKRAK